MTFLNKHRLTILGIFLGAIAGYIYYHFIGCVTGCSITSKPLNSTAYGGLMGGLLLNLFNKKTSKSG